MIDHTRFPGLVARAALLVAAAVLLAACGGGSTQAPAPTASPTQITEQQAVNLVLASDARFAGIRPLDPDLIGQAAWYEVSPAPDGWRVTVTKGWGDCIAGCINRHTWVYDVDRAGSVTLVEERGDPLEDGSDGGAVPPVDIPAGDGPWIVGRAMAGPTCPVVQQPPDPGCADRPVVGATVVVRDRSGAVVAEATTGEDGTFIARAPAGRTYTVEGRPVAGLLGTPAPTDVAVPHGAGAWAVVDLAYDTGIR